MTTYIFTIEFYQNGQLEYSTINGVYLDKEKAKEEVVSHIKMQAQLWESTPHPYKRIKNKVASVMLNHPSEQIHKVYTIKAMETK